MFVFITCQCLHEGKKPFKCPFCQFGWPYWADLTCSWIVTFCIDPYCWFSLYLINNYKLVFYLLISTTIFLLAHTDFDKTVIQKKQVEALYSIQGLFCLDLGVKDLDTPLEVQVERQVYSLFPLTYVSTTNKSLELKLLVA